MRPRSVCGRTRKDAILQRPTFFGKDRAQSLQFATESEQENQSGDQRAREHQQLNRVIRQQHLTPPARLAFPRGSGSSQVPRFKRATTICRYTVRGAEDE